MIIIQEAFSRFPQINKKELVLLMANALKKDIEYVMAHTDRKLSNLQYEKFSRTALKRMKREPIAYILGFQPFMSWNFKVNSSVLIPRPETEILVTRAIEDMRKAFSRKRKIIAVDVGAGSGCIACSVKKIFPDANVIASDISQEALRVVKYNSRKLSTTIKVIHSDLLNTKLKKLLQKEIDSCKKNQLSIFVLANLPYLPYSDAGRMQRDVIDYEPKIALFADQGGTALIKKCIHQFKLYKNELQDYSPEWNFYFEIDPPQAQALKKFAKENFPNAKIEIKKDLYAKNRFLLISFPPR